MYKTFGKIVIAALIGLLGLFSYGVLVDTEGNAVTNQTLLGDIDMGIGTAGDLKQFVITNGNDSVSSNFVRKSDAVMWHDNVQSNITVGNISSIGYGSISFSDIDGNYYIGDYSIALGYGNDAGNFSSVFGIDNYVGDFSLGFGDVISIGGYSASIGQHNKSGDHSYLFGYKNYARGNEDGYPDGDDKSLAFMMGAGNWTETDGSFLMGVGHHVGPYAQASFSFGTETAALHPGAFIWNFFPTNYFEMSVDDIMLIPKYNSHGIGSFNINPIGGLDGFWVGETNLSEHIDAKIVPYAIELINQLENGTIIPEKADNLRTDDGNVAYTATDLIKKSTNAANYAVSELVRTNSVLSNGPYLPLSGGDMTGDINTSSGIRFDYYSNTGMTVYAYSPMSLVFEVPGQSMNFGAVLELGDMQEGSLYTIAFKEEIDSVLESKRDKGDLELYVYSPWYCTNLGMPLEWDDSLNGWSLQSGNNYFLQYDYVTEEWQLYVNGMVESTLIGSPTDMSIYMSYAGMDYEFYRMNIYEPSSDRIAKVSDVDSALSDFASTNSVLANGPYLTQHQSLSPATNYTNWALNSMAETNAVLSNGPYLPLVGGTMSGNITFNESGYSSISYSDYFGGMSIVSGNSLENVKEYFFKPVGATESDEDVVRREDLSPLQLAAWYPDGSVTNASQFTQGLKYSFDDTDKTAQVLTFNNTGDSNNDNSGISGAVVIPPYVVTNGVKYEVVGVAKGSNVTNENTNLISVVAPTTVKNLGQYSFKSCKALTSISFPAATSYNVSTFPDCNGLVDVYLPKAAGNATSAFRNCTSLVSISLPEADLSRSMFVGCTSLVEGVFLSAKNIGQSTFSNCSSLKTLYVPSVTAIASSALSHCTSLESIDFGEKEHTSIPTLELSAFNDIPTTCKIIVPDAQYDAWKAAANWSTLVSNGYQFLRHSEWEYARRYELSVSYLVSTNAANYAVSELVRTNSVLSNGPYLPLSGGDMTGDINTSSGVRFDYYSNTGITVYAYSPMSLIFEVPGQSMNFGAVLELGDMQEGSLYTIAFKEEIDSVLESKRDKGDLELYVYSPWYCTNLGMPLEWDDSLNGWSLQSGNNYFLQYDYVTEEWQLYVNGMVESTLIGSPTDMSIYMSYAGMDYEFYRMNIYEPSSDRIAKVSDVDSALSDFASTNSVLANGPYLTQHQSLQPATNYTDSATNALETTIENMDTSYYRFTGITNVNQSVQYVHLNSSQTTLSIEKPISGTTKDWIVYVVAETNVTVNLPPGNFWCTTETVTNDIPQLTPTAFYFSQITEDTFCLGRQELTTIITIQSRDMKKGDRIKEVLNDKKKTRK